MPSFDMQHIERAIALARKGVGLTSPNPAVGAVIVSNGEVIGEGWHKKAGADHAEIVAIKGAYRRGDRLQGSTLYVTLEPCCHTGKTPPCVEAIIKSGIRQVVIGMADPNPAVNTKGVRALRRSGIAVTVLNTKSVQAQSIRLLNQSFIKWMMRGLPFTVLKAATSLDGKIATKTGDSQWITGKPARDDARLERSRCDAVLVGLGTVCADNPELAPHGIYAKKKVLRVIIDPELRSPLSSRVFRDRNVLVATTDRAPVSRQRAYTKKGIPFFSCGAKTVSIPSLLRLLAKQGIQSVFVEGGAGVHGSFMDAAMKDAQCVDKVVWYVAPKIIGGADAVSAVRGMGVRNMNGARSLQHVSVASVGEDVKIEGYYSIY